VDVVHAIIDIYNLVEEEKHMLSNNETIKISKTLSYVLRHNPASVGLELDENGWASVSELLSQLRVNGQAIDLHVLKHIVDTNTKKRFKFNEDRSKIRASQGHSIQVDLAYNEARPPTYLFHGTTEKFLAAIEKDGLHKMKRHHVHLSADVETALNVGQRHGKPIVLKIKAEVMFEEGYRFFRSENGVWLTEAVPFKFIEGPWTTRS
jgi:putative RNA 2'-phosphotransferase